MNRSDHILERDKPQRTLLLARQTDEATHKGRQRHDADMPLVAMLGDKIQSDRKAKIGDERKRMCRIHSQRCENGKDVASEKSYPDPPDLSC
jgi:hypothetical protein